MKTNNHLHNVLRAAETESKFKYLKDEGGINNFKIVGTKGFSKL